MFAAWVGEAGRVYAFEPAPDARAGLRTHVALNGFDARVEIVESAMSSSVGSAPFALHPSGGASSLSLRSVADAFHLVVDTDTIDNFCRVHALSPSVIKIDVEGSELDVLKGARHTLALPGTHAFVEFHPAAWAQAGIGRAEIEHELRDQGFAAEPLDPSYDPWATEGVSVRLRRR
jgi:FkbM family methyltransferase